VAVTDAVRTGPASDRTTPATCIGLMELWRGVVVTFFNHNFVNCKATLILAIKIYEIKYNISLNDIHT